LDTAVHPVSSD